MAKCENFYEKFKINSDATGAEIQKVYRALIRKYHPDVYKGHNAEQKTKRVNEIYEVLSDPDKRKAHDAALGITATNVYIYQGKKNSGGGAAGGSGKTATKTGGSSGTKTGGSSGTKTGGSSGTKTGSAAKPRASTGKTTAKKTQAGRTTTKQSAEVDSVVDEDAEEARLLRELGELSELLNLAEEEKRAELQAKIEEIDLKILKLHEAHKARAKKAAAKKTTGKKSATKSGAKETKTAESAPEKEEKAGEKKASGGGKKKKSGTAAASKAGAAAKDAETDSGENNEDSSAGKSKRTTKKTTEEKDKKAANADNVQPDAQDSGAQDKPAERKSKDTSGDTAQGSITPAGEEVASETQGKENLGQGTQTQSNAESPVAEDEAVAGSAQKAEQQAESLKASDPEPEVSFEPKQEAIKIEPESALESEETFAAPETDADGGGGKSEGKPKPAKTKKPKSKAKSAKKSMEQEADTDAEDAAAVVASAHTGSGDEAEPEQVRPADSGADESAESSGVKAASEPSASPEVILIPPSSESKIDPDFVKAVQEPEPDGAVAAEVVVKEKQVKKSESEPESEPAKVEKSKAQAQPAEKASEPTTKSGKKRASVFTIILGILLFLLTAYTAASTYVAVTGDTEALSGMFRFMRPTESAETIELNYNAGEGGSIQGAAVQPVKNGESGTPVTAVPADRYWYFDCWSDGVLDAVRYDANVTESKTVTAYFKRFLVVNYTAADENGTVVGDIVGGAEQLFKPDGSGAVVTAVAHHPLSYEFSGWYADGHKVSDERTHTATAELAGKTVTARFLSSSAVVHTVSYSVQEGGFLVGRTEQEILNGEDGTEVQAVPQEGWYFAGWFDASGNPVAGIDGGDKHKVTEAAKDIVYTAKFERYLIVQYLTDGAGTVTNAVQNVKKGESGTESTAEPLDSNYYFAGWFDAGGNSVAGTGGGNRHTAANVQENLSLTAKFERYLVVQYLTDGAGTVTNAVQKVKKGESGKAVTAEPENEQVYFVCWKRLTSGVWTVDSENTGVSRTEINISADISILAVFRPRAVVTILADGGGTLSHGTDAGQVEVIQYVTPGGNAESVTAVVTNSSTHYFAGWFLNGTEISAEPAYALSDVTGDATLRAVFRPFVTITYTADGNGEVKRAGDTGSAAAVTLDGLKWNENGVQVTAVETDPEYYFDGWYIANVPVGTAPARTDNAGTANFTVTARFVKKYELSYYVYNYDYVEGVSDNSQERIGGKISGEIDSKTIWVRHGSDAPVICAEPDTGWIFYEWQVYDGGAWEKDTSKLLEWRVDSVVGADLQIRAVFQKCYTVTYTAGENGRVDGELLQYVRRGGNSGSPVSAVADTGYYFDGWTVVSGSADNTITSAVRFEENVTGDMELEARFKPYVTVRYVAGANGEIRDAGGNVKTGTWVQTITESGICEAVLAAALNPSAYYFDGWYLDYGLVSQARADDSINPLRLTDGAALDGKTLTAVFAQWSVFEFSAETNGTLIGLTEQKLRTGEQASVQAVPDYGYSFAYWLIKDEHGAWIPDYAQDAIITLTAEESNAGITTEAKARFIKGNGEESSPYEISGYESLLSANRFGTGAQKKYFLLTADLDFSGVTDFTPLCPEGFTGVLSGGAASDGTNKTIYGLSITTAVSVFYEVDEETVEHGMAAGLFAKLCASAEVKNLFIHSSTLTVTGQTENLYAGILAGVVTDQVILSGIKLKLGDADENPCGVAVSAVSDGMVYAGGLVGRIFGSPDAKAAVNSCAAYGIGVTAESSNGTDAYAGFVCGIGKNVSIDNPTLIQSKMTGNTGKVGCFAGVLEGAAGTDYTVNNTNMFGNKAININDATKTEVGLTAQHSYNF